jgi:hypothetical protein
MSALLRKYGVQTDIYFPLIDAGTNNFAVSGDYTHASGDVKVSKDGGAAATATNSPSAITMGNGAMWKLTLTATEMEAAKVVVTVIDATTKAIEDQMILIETYGSASGEHLFDLDSYGYPLKKGVALDNYTFVMADNSGTKTGLTVTAERSIDGAAFASCANSVTELSSGTYTIDLSTSDLNGNIIVLKFTATNANPTIQTLILPT